MVYSKEHYNGMVNICESLINVVSRNKPKMLNSPRRADRLEPKGKWSGTGVIASPVADVAPPAERRDLTHIEVLARNVVSPLFSRQTLSARESEPQGTLMGQRVWDVGESECRSVIERIGVEPCRGQAASPHAKAGRLPAGVSSRESLINHPDKGRQMIAETLVRP